jgi:ribonuclease T1
MFKPSIRATLSVLLAFSVTVSTEAQAFYQSRQAEDQTATQALDQVIGLSQLPRQGQDVYERILSGGPFRYDKDGVVFGNRERQLPRQTRGYYREYTVPTPGSRDRGARRIVCGGKFVQSPETCFYTQDHYQSFQKIDPQR